MEGAQRGELDGHRPCCSGDDELRQDREEQQEALRVESADGGASEAVTERRSLGLVS
jgi:hypothetical protein